MKEQDLKAKLADLGGQYRVSDSVAEREGLSTQIREATVQLQNSLAKGAKACPNETKDNPHRVIGMLKTPAHYDSASGMEIPDVYEVGCIVCPPVLVPFDEAEHKFSVDHPSEKGQGRERPQGRPMVAFGPRVFAERGRRELERW
jgi:hypothetical protein